MRKWLLATAALAVLGLTALLVLPLLLISALSSSASVPCPVSLVPSVGVFLGANAADLTTVQSQAGQQLGLDRTYSQWGDQLPSTQMLSDQSAGRLPALSVKPLGVSLQAVADGSQDEAIKRQAAGIKAYGTPVLLTFDHEPEQDGAAAAAPFVAAWRHYVQVFRGEAVTNVSWTLILESSTLSAGAGDAWYPGDDVVNWIGADGYNWAGDPEHPGAAWTSFTDIFGAFVSWAGPHGKPLLIGEFASGDDPNDPTRKPQWIAQAAQQIKAWPQVKALAWFEVEDWQKLNTDADRQAFAALAANPYFQARPQASSAGPPGTLPAPTGANETDVWAALVGQGFSEVAAAGVMGNMQTESGFDPLIVQGGGRSLNPADAGGGGYGLVQWTPGAKLVPLLHGALPSIGSEVAALAVELRTTEVAAADALRQATTPEQAADVFGLQYERYAGPPQPVRAAQAAAIYAQHVGTAPVSADPGAPGTCLAPTGGGPLPAGGGVGVDSSGIPCVNGDPGHVEAAPGGVPIRLCLVNGFTVNTLLVSNLSGLLAAATADGITFGGGAFRSEGAQIALRRAHCGPTDYDVYQRPSSHCSPPTAIPGQSLHEWGLAIDFSAGGSTLTRGSSGFKWLTANATTFGLTNLQSEPWHWSTSGL